MSRKIYKFEEYAILENGGPAFSTAGGYPQSSVYNHQVNDYSLSSDPSDRYEMNMKSGIFRLTSIIRTMIDNGAVQVGGHVSDFSDIEKITELKILRMFKNDNMLLDIFITFVVDDEEYYGVFENYGGIAKPLFKSEIQRSLEYNKNFLMKLEGLIIKALSRFFTPEKGMYKALTDVVVQDKYGIKHTIDKDKSMKVEDVIYDEQDSYIQMDVKTGRKTNETFYLKGIDYYFFNYWFGEYTVKDANE
jgi:hypothetical protein